MMNHTSGFGKIKLLLILAVIIIAFLASGWVELGGRTPLAHLDQLFGTDVFQDSHDNTLTGVADETKNNLEDGGNEVLENLQNGGEKVMEKTEDLKDEAGKKLKDSQN